MLFIVKLFPEITIKSKPVRKQMTKRLRDNLLMLLRDIDADVEVVNDWDNLKVHSSKLELRDDLVRRLSITPGIAYFLEVESHAFETKDDICQHALNLFAERLKDKTFVLRCKRSGKHEFSSHDIEIYVGGYLNQHSEAKGVNLHNPEVTVNLEIKNDRLFAVKQRHDGLGGFPLGEVEPVVSLISGGFDSPVASYLCMKRGMPTHFCFFNLGGRDHELGVKEVAYYLWEKFGASRRVKFVAVPFEGVVAEILQQVDNSQMGVILKRMMLRAATKVAEELDVQALVTGEAVAQVSSQTLTNLSVIDNVTDMLVLRPLIASDKDDIISVSRKIGTEEFAASMPEYCGVISVKPTTRAKMPKILSEEERFDFSVLERAIADAEYINIDQLASLDHTRTDVEEIQVPLPDTPIIDVRHPDDVERKALSLPGVEVLNIPFYLLHKQFAELDKSKKYLLYCDKGVMSRLHASHLAEDGANVAVYRPPH